jgi:hypothetical protein
VAKQNIMAEGQMVEEAAHLMLSEKQRKTKRDRDNIHHSKAHLQ